MPSNTVTYCLNSSDETARIACHWAKSLAPGDVLLLNGPVGAGKTHFARALIQSLLDVPEDVPSPTFTLIQTYDTRLGPVWHADLYRVGSTLDVEELGLLDAFETAICLVEWPDRLGDLCPNDALDISLADGETDDQRILTASWTNQKWDTKIKRCAA